MRYSPRLPCDAATLPLSYISTTTSSNARFRSFKYADCRTGSLGPREPPPARSNHAHESDGIEQRWRGTGVRETRQRWGLVPELVSPLRFATPRRSQDNHGSKKQGGGEGVQRKPCTSRLTRGNSRARYIYDLGFRVPDFQVSDSALRGSDLGSGFGVWGFRFSV